MLTKLKSIAKQALYLVGFAYERAVTLFGSRGQEDVVLGADGHHVFFGYYDVTPFSKDGKIVLACRTDLRLASPDPVRKIELGYYDLAETGEKKFNYFAESVAWCWQQGARLQWMPGSNDEVVLFNNRTRSGQYEGVLFHVARREVVNTIARPLYDISQDGKWGLSLDFSRLQRLRPGYGYDASADLTADDLVPSGACLELINIEQNRIDFTFSYAELLGFEPVPDMHGAEHYINHLSFSPSGHRFIFFHMWVSNGKRASRLLLVDRQSGGVTLLNNSGKCSHYAWNGDSELLVYCAPKKGESIGYHLYDLDKLAKSPEKVGPGVLVEDGHPSFLPGGERFLTDTYPNRFGRQTLMLFDRASNQLVWSRSLFRSSQYRGEVRCDLHPRLDVAATKVCVDDEFNGSRVMRIIKLDV